MRGPVSELWRLITEELEEVITLRLEWIIELIDTDAAAALLDEGLLSDFRKCCAGLAACW